MAENNGNGEKKRLKELINWQSLIQAIVLAVLLGGGGFFSLADIKTSMRDNRAELRTDIKAVESELKSIRELMSTGNATQTQVVTRLETAEREIIILRSKVENR